MRLEPIDHPSDKVQWTTYQPQAWIMGFIDTGVPGYREVELAGVRGVVPSSVYRWNDWLTAMGTAAGTTFFDEEWFGQIVCDGGAPTWRDRSGWLMGWRGAESGQTPSVGIGSAVPPACIPCLGATWTDVELRHEIRGRIDRLGRSSGYVWGAARVWRVVAKMHRWSLEALDAGWCLSGRVNVVPTNYPNRDTWPAWSSANPTGYLDGYILNGLERVRWLDRIERMAEVTFLLAATP